MSVVQGDTDRIADRRRHRRLALDPGRRRHRSSARLETLAEQSEGARGRRARGGAADLEIADGAVRVAGTDRAISLRRDRRAPDATPDALKGGGDFVPPDATYPNGTHVCEVEIDPDTGETHDRRYTIVDDFGVTLNPLLLAGQVHGGVVQGIGQALHESTRLRRDGQLVTATFMDYAMPRADDCRDFHFETRNVPSTTNPLGIKGAGEAGTIGACAGGHERGRRRALARLRHPPYRHAGDAGARARGDRRRRRRSRRLRHITLGPRAKIRTHFLE